MTRAVEDAVFSQKKDFWEDVDAQTWLSSLLSLVESNRNRPFDQSLFIELLTDAFETPPLPFSEDWLEVFPKDYEDSSEDELKYTTDVIKFMIADLRRMEGKQLLDPYRFYGVDSPSGHRWYNFEPVSLLEAGFRCIRDGSSEEALSADQDTTPVSWSDLGLLLVMSRIYE